MAGKQQNIGEWLYFCPKEIDVRDFYAAVCDRYETEIWEEAGVLEIMLGEKASFDVEHAKISPKDEITAAFAKEQNAECVFLISFAPDWYAEAQKLMKQILEEFGGIFCGDTQDFLPQVKL